MKTKTNVKHKLMGFGFAALFVACGFSANAQDSTATSGSTTTSTYSTEATSAKPKKSKSDIGDRAFRFGVKAGLNLSQLYVSGVDVEDRRNKVGIHGGLWAKIPTGDLFAIQPELLYTNNGSRISYQATTVSGLGGSEVRFNMNYIQLPILASLTLGPISIQAGPYVSYLLNANVKNVELDNAVDPTTIAELNENSFHRVDYGLAGGIAFDIKGFQLGARYNHGLRETSQNGLSGLLPNNAKNGVAQVFVSVGL
jgi:hypothetical protein